MFNEKVPPQGSQVRLHNYRKLGHRQRTTHTPRDKHLERWKAQKNKQWFIIVSQYCVSSFSFRDAQHEIIIDRIYFFNNSLCFYWAWFMCTNVGMLNLESKYNDLLSFEHFQLKLLYYDSRHFGVILIMVRTFKSWVLYSFYGQEESA